MLDMRGSQLLLVGPFNSEERGVLLDELEEIDPAIDEYSWILPPFEFWLGGNRGLLKNESGS